MASVDVNSLSFITASTYARGFRLTIRPLTRTSMSNTVHALSLPPEILENILGDVVESVNPEERPWTALTLTHVCGSFRHVALSCPNLWTCLSRKLGRPGLALIEACIERSQNRPLDVVLYLYGLRDESGSPDDIDEVVVDSIARTVLPFSARWRTYSAIVVVKDKFSNQNVIPLADFRSMSSNLDTPLLEEFTLKEQTDLPHLLPAGSLFHLYPILSQDSWNIPSLHTLVLENTLVSGIPSEFRVPLRHASVSYVRRNVVYHLNTLRSLAIGPSLTTLRLSFNGCHFSRKYADPTLNELPHVKSLHIEFLGCTQSAWNDHNLWKSFRMFRFPSAVDLTMLIDIGDASFVLWDGLRSFDVTLHGFLVTDPDHRYPFPCLETLDVEVRPRRGHGGPELLLPHCCLPSLKHLRIRCSFALTLSDNIGDFNVGSLPRHFTTGQEVVPIALQSVTLDLPHVGGVVSWIEGLALKMQSQRCWSGFAELTVKNGGSEVEATLRDEIERWCDLNRNGPAIPSPL